MPRRALPPSAILPYHITARCNRRERFPIEIEEVWKVFEDYLFLTSKGFGLEILSFVLMPNHVHLIARDPKLQMGSALNYLMRETSKEIGRLGGVENHLWGGRVYRSVIATNLYLSHAYKYVYRNPVHAGLCERVEDYPYSTLRGLLGFERCIIPVEEDHFLFSDIEGNLGWLNSRPAQERYLEVKKALRRKEFKLPRDSKTKRCSILESAPY